MSSQIVGVLAAAGQKDADAAKLEKGSWVAKNATQYNYLLHHEVEKMLEEVDSKKTEEEKREVRNRYIQLDQERNEQLSAICTQTPDVCKSTSASLVSDDQKLVELVSQLRAQGKGPTTLAVGSFIDSNLSATNIIAAEIKAADGGALETLAAEGVKAGVGVVAIKPGAGKGKGSALPVPDSKVASNGLNYKSNPKHTLGGDGNRANAGIEPKNSIDIFESSIPSSKVYNNKEVRYGVDDVGGVHRFEGTNGEFHWNGSTGDLRNPLNKSDIPNDIKKQLGVGGKGR